MILVPVQADRSPIHGLGLFALESIPAGTPIWRFEPGFDRTFSEVEFDALPEPARRHLRHYGWFDAARRTWVLDGDLAIFMNHAPVPSTGAPSCSGPAPETVALRPIAPGEELTCDYRAFDASDKPLAAG